MTRERILARLRGAPLAEVKLPSPEGPWTTYEDFVAQFRNSLADAGGECIEVSEELLEDAVRERIAAVGAKRTVSTVRVIAPEAAVAAGARDYADVDVAICRAAFGVAENAAVWIDGRDVPQPSLLFLSQHLVLVLAREQIVQNMHEAYARLAFSGCSYGTFISGPSKTADIEQSLVIGAHGPKSLTVMLLADVRPPHERRA